MALVICPFCLKPHDFSSFFTCSKYQEAVPAVYVKDYQHVPPLWLVTIGFSQHGKTTYLAALTLTLESISPVWNDVYYRALDQYTTNQIRKMHREAMFGEAPAANPKQVHRPLLFNVYGTPGIGSRCLVMYDVSGEIFTSLTEVQEYVTSLKQVNTSWFFVSIKDLLDDQEGKTLPELFSAYLAGMEGLRVDLKGRNLILVYTKADLVSFPKPIRDYLRSDPLQGLTLPNAETPDLSDFDMLNYMKEMESISLQLKEYTKKLKGGAAFIKMVEANEMNLCFCVTSALGENPDTNTNRLRVEARRYRVLDPFLWAITLEKPVRPREINLVVDASRGSEKIYDVGYLPKLWSALSDYGALTTYYLGQSISCSQPGQSPPTAAPRSTYPRVIGPLIENAKPDEHFIAVITGPINDLDDFQNSPWRDRLLLVSPNEHYHPNWPNKVIYRPGDDPILVINAFLK